MSWFGQSDVEELCVSSPNSSIRNQHTFAMAHFPCITVTQLSLLRRVPSPWWIWTMSGKSVFTATEASGIICFCSITGPISTDSRLWLRPKMHRKGSAAAGTALGLTHVFERNEHESAVGNLVLGENDREQHQHEDDQEYHQVQHHQEPQE